MFNLSGPVCERCAGEVASVWAHVPQPLHQQLADGEAQVSDVQARNPVS